MTADLAIEVKFPKEDTLIDQPFTACSEGARATISAARATHLLA
jgi:hypothetical protein